MINNAKKYNMRFARSVKLWDEAVPLGNGKLGCLIYGDAKPLIFALDRVDIWDTTPNPATLRDDFTYASLIALVKGGKKNQAEIVERFDDIYNYPTPTKLPVGHIELFFDNADDKIQSELNLYNAVATLQFGDTTITSFVHSGINAGIIRIVGQSPKIEIKPPLFKDKNYVAPKDQHEKVFSNKLAALGYENAANFCDGNVFWVAQKTSCELEYGIFYAFIKNGDTTTIAYTVAANNENNKNTWITDAKTLVKTVLKEDFDSLTKSHTRDWHKFYKRSNIDIPDKILEKSWYVNNYLLYSCSREGGYPTPLQGVWTADNGFLPPWKGDYHHDLNTQFSYYGYLKANHLSCGKCFCDYLWDNKAAAEKFAESFFDARGAILYPTVSAINGAPLGGWPQYSLNLVNNIWLCEAFDNYYSYSGDENFLKTRAYPYFKGVARGVTRWLEKDKDGAYTLPLSSSPEVFDNTFEAWQKPLTTNDLTLLIYLFETLIKYSRILQTSEGKKWAGYLDALPKLPLDKTSALMMNSESSLPSSHRHLGHLMSIYPFHMLSYDTASGKKTIDASISQLEKLGDGESCCFTYAWKAALYAIQKNGNAAWRYLRIFTDYIISQNGFNLNFDYKNYGVHFWHERPFTLESNFAFNASLQDTLLYCKDDIIEVFPAIPDNYCGNASFENFLTQKGVTVSAKIRENVLQFITLFSSRPVQKKVLNSFNTTKISILKDSAITFIDCQKNSYIELNVLGSIKIIPS